MNKQCLTHYKFSINDSYLCLKCNQEFYKAHKFEKAEIENLTPSNRMETIDQLLLPRYDLSFGRCDLTGH